MSFFKTLFSGGDVIKEIGDSVDKIFTSDEERLELKNEFSKAELGFEAKYMDLVSKQNIAQTEVNKVEASSGAFFQSGWRPAIGWIGVAALAYKFVIYPLLLWMPNIAPPNPIDSDILFSMVTGMLGIAGMRSFDKLKQTNTG
jgi:hypothetical protein